MISRVLGLGVIFGFLLFQAPTWAADRITESRFYDYKGATLCGEFSLKTGEWLRQLDDAECTKAGDKVTVVSKHYPDGGGYEESSHEFRASKRHALVDLTQRCKEMADGRANPRIRDLQCILFANDAFMKGSDAFCFAACIYAFH